MRHVSYLASHPGRCLPVGAADQLVARLGGVYIYTKVKPIIVMFSQVAIHGVRKKEK